MKMKSTSGTIAMKSSEICKIIESCGQYGVSSIKMGDIEISFNGFVKHYKEDYPEKVNPVEESVIADPKLEEQLHYEMAQDVIENLAVTDPLAYEEMMANKENYEDSETMIDGE